MTQYGVLRTWAVFLTFIGVVSVLAATIGTIIWAFEVDGFWQTLGVVLVGGPLSLFFASLPIALGQALRALADVGETVAAR
jgi:Na+-transporting NADH:ubiquinone oxidoreductase subunit NqrB